MKITDDLVKVADDNSLISMLLLDLSAAFDALDHNILLYKLEHEYGIKRNALLWFKSYLENSQFSVHINGTKYGLNHI